jgi:8-oxo-dGTP diphosphatase
LSVVCVIHSRSERERVSFAMVAEHWRGTPHNMEPDKCDDPAWFPPDALPANTVPYVRRALLNYARGCFYDCVGWD